MYAITRQQDTLVRRWMRATSIGDRVGAMLLWQRILRLPA